jgi:FHS family L-fucose permease-like MFS transporter
MDLLGYRHFLLAVVAQFMYVGAQVGTWSYFIQYVQDYIYRPEKIAGYFLTGTLAALITQWRLRSRGMGSSSGLI